MDQKLHQSQLAPQDNKFHSGNIGDGKHYWLTPPALLQKLDAEFRFNFDPCPYPKPEGFDGLTCDWGASNYVNPPFGSIIHEGKKKGPTAWARKAIAEHQKGKTVVLVYPVDKWILMLMEAGAQVRNLGDVRWLATEDGSEGKGTGRHIACFVLDAAAPGKEMPQAWLDVQAERRRQVENEGWTPEHDDGHACDEIAAFACYYAMPPAVRDWDASSTGYGYTLGEAVLPEGWEPKTGDRRRELVKACALALAEIERLDRAAATQGGPRDA